MVYGSDSICVAHVGVFEQPQAAISTISPGELGRLATNDEPAQPHRGAGHYNTYQFVG
jgi:hypothetical protein